MRNPPKGGNYCVLSEYHKSVLREYLIIFYQREGIKGGRKIKEGVGTKTGEREKDKRRVIIKFGVRESLLLGPTQSNPTTKLGQGTIHH